MTREDDGVEVEDGGGRVEEEVERRRGVVVVTGVVVVVVVMGGGVVVVMGGEVVLMGGVVVVKMITCLVVWQPSQGWGWTALGEKAGEGVKSIVSGVGEEGGEVGIRDWGVSVSIWEVVGFSEGGVLTVSNMASLFSR